MPGTVEVQLSDQLRSVFAIVTGVVATFNIIILFFFSLSTAWGDTRGAIKKSEKYVLYNVVAPDFLLTIFLFIFICPSTYMDSWSYSVRTTTLLGYCHLLAILDPLLAMGNICRLVGFATTNATSYDNINRRHRMLALCGSYTALGACLCTLPATEKFGFAYNPRWFFPQMTLVRGYGGLFTILSTTAVSFSSTISGLLCLMEKRQEVQDMGKKANRKVIAELYTSINFCGMAVALTLAVPLIIAAPISDYKLCFVLRMFVYASPSIRVFMLSRTCPHFKFVKEQDDIDLEDFAELALLN